MKNTLRILAVIVLALVGLNGTIDLNNLFNYDDQDIPLFVNRDNTPLFNPIRNEQATLGRVLFYDQNMSANNTVSCASCHKQEFAFGDNATLSEGLNGELTGRHSMRLVNARFADEVRFFWDERAPTLEAQTSRPIQDHIEMGFSGEDGDPDLDSLIRKLENVTYYESLFTFAFGDATITEQRMQRALAQFIRSMQSFDSKYDAGRSQVNNNNQPFPNFTAVENQGKQLFQTPGNQGGAGCAGCHRPPTFDIDPDSGNNGVIGVAGSPGELDLTNTRAPSLRDVIGLNGLPNGPFMHDGSLPNLMAVLNHYDDIDFNPAVNPQLDVRLRGGPGAGGQTLNLTQQEKQAIIAFLGTLTGNDIYNNEKWSNPFDEDGELVLIPLCAPPIPVTVAATICDGESVEGYTTSGIFVDVFTAANGCDSIRHLELIVLPSNHPDCAVSSTTETTFSTPKIFPNPFREQLNLHCEQPGLSQVQVHDLNGRLLFQQVVDPLALRHTLYPGDLPMGLYLLSGYNVSGQRLFNIKTIKE